MLTWILQEICVDIRDSLQQRGIPATFLLFSKIPLGKLLLGQPGTHRNSMGEAGGMQQKRGISETHPSFPFTNVLHWTQPFICIGMVTASKPFQHGW